MLETFFTSQVRVKILKLFFLSPEERYHVREITRKTNEEINAVRRELSRLYKIKLLGREKRGNRLYYFLRDTFLIYPELFRMIIKEYGVGNELHKKEKELGKIKYAAIAFEWYQNRLQKHEEVDMLLVGTVNLKAVNEVMAKIEHDFHKEINYAVLKEEEFGNMKQMSNTFIQKFLAQDLIVFIGEESKFKTFTI